MDLQWGYVADTVMGGVSQGSLSEEIVAGRQAWRLRGSISLDNNGGFIQMAADLPPRGGALNASSFSGVAFEAIDVAAFEGLRRGETYNVHLRTADLTRPWQSYRQSFMAGAVWETHRIAFEDFEPHRASAPLDLSRLRRIGVLAIGRPFQADIAIADMRLV
ncbi:MAG: CIA30 family protein [Pseudomonadota bacterium]